LENTFVYLQLQVSSVIDGLNKNRNVRCEYSEHSEDETALALKKGSGTDAKAVQGKDEKVEVRNEL
jgi:hypothetical protein